MRYAYNSTIYTKNKVLSAEISNQLNKLESIEQHIESCIYKNIAVKEYVSILKDITTTKHTLLNKKHWHDKLIFEMDSILKSYSTFSL